MLTISKKRAITSISRSLEQKMAKDIVVVVESPTKAKTVGRFVGANFVVLASYGHVFELLPKNGSVDPDNHFSMNYQPVEKNKKHLDKPRCKSNYAIKHSKKCCQLIFTVCLTSNYFKLILD